MTLPNQISTLAYVYDRLVNRPGAFGDRMKAIRGMGQTAGGGRGFPKAVVNPDAITSKLDVLLEAFESLAEQVSSGKHTPFSEPPLPGRSGKFTQTAIAAATGVPMEKLETPADRPSSSSTRAAGIPAKGVLVHLEEYERLLAENPREAGWYYRNNRDAIAEEQAIRNRGE